MTEPISAAPPTSKRRPWLGRALALLLVAGLSASAWWLVQRAKAPAAAAAQGGRPGAGPGGAGLPGGPGGAGGPGAATVGVARAQAGQLPITLDALGTVTPVLSVALRPQVSGLLTEVLFTEGQWVRKGQLLARIDAAPFQQALAQAQGDRARNEAQLAAARVTLTRYQTLWQQDSIARQDVDTQAALVKQLEGTVQSNRAAEGSARINLGWTQIVAPMAGRIGLRAVDAGNMVQAGGGTSIATITQMAPIDVKFAVPQDRVPDVLAAQRQGAALPVQAFDRARTQVLASGRFMTLDNVIDTSTGTLQAKARFDNLRGELFPNQFVNVRLQLGSTPGVLVPVTAVRTGPSGDYVYVLDAERVAHMRAVQRGGATVEQVLIGSGLQAGETVVTEGGDRVKDGGKVMLAGEGRGPRGAASAAAGARGPRGAARAASAPAAAAPSAASEANPALVGVNASSSAADSGASEPARPASGAWLERLPPALREKVLAMPPEQRRAYLQQLREQRAQRQAP